ncbi:MAG: hypothetical protein PWQ55_737 [Chloroflexota bacterium]|nr:hypothetical protein [Chloroflexota bacterium]
MNNKHHNPRILPVFRKKWLHRCCLLLAFFCVIAMAPFPDATAAELAERGYAKIPTEAQVVLSGVDILAGHGVSVVYQTQGPQNLSGYLPFEYQCTTAGCFQCIEFVLWLYNQQLGYLYPWPGAIWSPYQLIGVAQIANQLTYQVDTGLLSTQDAQYRLYEPFIDLRYHPNGSSVAPQPGDILISADGGHSMVVNRSAGDQVEIVQQNAWEIAADPAPSPLEMRQVYITGDTYSVQNSLGWIHSPRWGAVLARSGSLQTVGEGIRWQRAADVLTLYLPAVIERSPESISAILQLLEDNGALQLTNPAYVACQLTRLGSVLDSSEPLEITIPYIGGVVRVRTSGELLHELPNDSCGWQG